MKNALQKSVKKRNIKKSVKKRVIALLQQPVFWTLTIFGNGMILLGSFVFYYFESDSNPALQSFLDSLTVNVGLITTVGFGSITPVTSGGKIVTMIMMMTGAVFIWTYMALFVSALIAPDLGHLEHEIKDIESDISQIRKDGELDIQTAERLIESIETLNQNLAKASGIRIP